MENHQQPINQQEQSQNINSSHDSISTVTKPEEEELQLQIKNQFQILNKLGSGAYGHVWKVQHKISKQFFALKKVFSAFQNEVDAQRTYRQISYLTKLKHQNVIKLKKVIKAQNNLDLYLLFEYMESDLFYAIKQDLLNDLHKKYIIYQIAKCLKYVHSAGLLHRDIKPSNILINPNCEVKLCDFGLSRTLYKYNNVEPKLTQFIATRWYRAPQVLFGSQFYNTKSDMWSLGCLIYQLYAQRPLLPGNDTVQQIQKVLQFKGMPNNQQKKSFKISKIDQILGLFDIQKKSLQSYFQYIPCQQIKQILVHLLQYNPQKRWSALDLLNCSFLEQFRDYQSENFCEKQIKTGINDCQRKTLQVYRYAIYDTFVQKQNQKNGLNGKTFDKSKVKLSDKTFRSLHKQVKQNENSRKSLQNTKQASSRRSVGKSNTFSLHAKKQNDYNFMTHRKNISSHTQMIKLPNKPNYFSSPVKKFALTDKGQSKQKIESISSIFKKIDKSTIFLKTSLAGKTKISKQSIHYPEYLRSKTPSSQIPKMIQEKLFQQRQTSSMNQSCSKLRQKSPYIKQLVRKNSINQMNIQNQKNLFGISKNNSSQIKQNINNGRKLKRKGKIN